VGGDNLYLYVPNPVGWLDPFGLKCEESEFKGNITGRSNVDALHPELNLQHDVVAHQGWYARKQHRKDIHKATWSQHGGKHIKAKTAEQAEILSHKQAQYLPEVNNNVLEKTALQKGIIVEKESGGAFYSFFRSNDVIGYDQGKPTRWIRSEWSSGVYHGHPMKRDRIRKYIPNAEE
jgi:hypothetical protein